MKPDVFLERFGDPEYVYSAHGWVIYAWGVKPMDPTALLAVFYTRDEFKLGEWLVARIRNDRVIERIQSAAGGQNSDWYAKAVIDFRRSYLGRHKPSFPGGLRCTTQSPGWPFVVLEDRDLVHPRVWATLHNSTSRDLEVGDLFLTVIHPDGKVQRKRITEGVRKRTLKPGDVEQVQKIPMLFWADDETKISLGEYRFFAQWNGARSEMGRATIERIHRQLVLPSPNNTDEEIVVTIDLRKPPQHRVSHEDLFKQCRTIFKNPFRGDPSDVKIIGVDEIEMDGGPGETVVMLLPEQFPLREFADARVRPKKRELGGRALP